MNEKIKEPQNLTKTIWKKMVSLIMWPDIEGNCGNQPKGIVSS
jgi:hypothetical protein